MKQYRIVACALQVAALFVRILLAFEMVERRQTRDQRIVGLSPGVMTTSRQAVFIRSMPDALAVADSDGSGVASRRPSFLDAYSFGGKSRRETLDGTGGFDLGQEREREDDLETVLDTTVDAKPYDESGKRTYERACAKMGVTPISCCLRQLEASQTLDLSFYGLSARGVIPVAMALVINSNITRLLLPGNSLGLKGFSYIQKMMDENNSIAELDLSSNNLLSEGMLAVVEMLKTNKSLTDLNLSDNGFVESDSYALAKVLESNARLQNLNLSKNHFGDESAHAFSHMIAENTSLQDLDLSWNHFRNKGGTYLAKGLG
ncbi:leucine-rich repeat-containing protein 74b-like, partial [Plakobranchus ocellatus]